MLGIIFQRFIHGTSASMTGSRTSILAKLRKSTGYPLTNCKKALELFPDDIAKAEEWLHAEAKSKGWSKWAKIQTRTATQGLIGVYSKSNIGVMVEINCETDFVSRNAEFQQLVEKMLSGCMNYAANLKLENEITKAVLDEQQLSGIPCETSTLGELIMTSTMKFNEKTVAKRAVFLKVPNDVLLNSLSHPAVLCPNLNGGSLGKYGVIVASKEKKTDASDTTEDTTALRINLCHHIIGMNPLSVGHLTDKDIAKFLEKSSPCEKDTENVDDQSELKIENTQTFEQVQPESKMESENTSEQSEDQETMDSELKESNETELLFQSYLMEPSVTVGETLFKSGIEVLAFERFECGETAEESPAIAVAASA